MPALYTLNLKFRMPSFPWLLCCPLATADGEADTDVISFWTTAGR